MSQVYPTNTGATENPSVQDFSFNEPKVYWLYLVWIIALTYAAIFGVLNKFVLSKRAWYKVLEDSLAEDAIDKAATPQKPAHDQRFQLSDSVRRAVLPLHHGLFGRVAYALMLLVSLLWPVLYLVVLFDYYWQCQVLGIDALCFYGQYPIFGNYDVNGLVLFTIWALSSTWFAFWLTFQGQIVNWFRVSCPAQRATHVLVRQQELHAEVLTADPTFLVRLFRRAQGAYRKKTDEERYFELTVPVVVTPNGTRYFLFQGTRHFYNPKLGAYQPIQPFHVGSLADFHAHKAGASDAHAASLLDSIGPNEIPFKVDSALKLLTTEFFTFFYLYQWVMYTVWFWFSYLFVAAMLVSIVFLAAALNIFTSWRNQRAIAKVAQYETQVEVLRTKEGGAARWLKISCLNLVPGDLIKLQEDWKLPCDLVVVQGACVCDESSLTGEAHPIQKIECPNDAGAAYTVRKGARYTLYAGTTLLQLERGEHDEVLAVVTATGIQTSKGQLISHILFPQRVLFKYDEELPIVAAILITYALIVFPLAIYFQNLAGSNSTWVTKWAYGIFTVSQILNPILPVTLTVGQIKSSIRLGFRKIQTLNPARIAVSGKIRLFCFDKTGTLTKPGLDFLRFQQASRARLEEGSKIAEWAMATAHAVTQFKEQYIGNQVEVRMFEACGYSLRQRGGQPPIVVSPKGVELDVVKRFEFDHSRMTMSVLVRDPAGHYYVFIKGSFEAVAGVADPATVPGSYNEDGKKLALDGVYVLGVGFKRFDWDPSYSLEKLSRDDVEAKGSITMLGYLLFRNELKEDTPAAIQELRDGAVRPVMVTGDNAQTGFFIARKCSMLDSGVLVLLAQLENGSMVWRPMAGADEPQFSDVYSTTQVRAMHERLEEGSVQLAVNGAAFQALRVARFFDDMLYFFRIFARVTPEEKVEVVQMFRDRGLIVGMCGDGGNDCGALRIAHAGVALSDAEASLVSPFTSQDNSIMSVVELLKEGRCALHTSFGAYKFIIIYGQLFAILKLCSFWYGVILCQMDYLMFDGVAVITLPIAMTLAMPLKRLNQYRPTSSLFSPTTIASVMGLMIIYLVFMAGALLHMRSHPDYVEWPSKLASAASWWVLGDNWESSVIYFQQFFAFIGAGLVFSFGSKYRQPFFRNYIFVVALLSLFVINALLLLLPQSGFTQLWHIASQQFNSEKPTNGVWLEYQAQGGAPSPAMPAKLRGELFAIAMGSIATAVVWQRFVVEGTLGNVLAARKPSLRPQFRV